VLDRDVAGDNMTSEVIEDEKQFYSKAKIYWKQIPPTVDGMLGGYGHISNIDLNSSRKFLQRFLRVGRSDVLSKRRGHSFGGTGGALQGATSTQNTAGCAHLLVAATKALKSWVGVGVQLLDWICFSHQAGAGCMLGTGRWQK
jgi:hypothetical protein